MKRNDTFMLFVVLMFKNVAWDEWTRKIRSPIYNNDNGIWWSDRVPGFGNWVIHVRYSNEK